MELLLPSQINANGLIPFLALLNSAGAAAEITLDFADLRRVSPAGLAALTATVNLWRKERRRVFFKNLDRCDITGYLQRMDVIRACGMTLPERFVRHDAEGRFVPIRELDIRVNQIGHEMALCVAPGGDDYESPMSGPYDLVWYVLTETANNVRQHSGGIGYAAAQVGRHEGLVRLSIADHGKGIRQSFIDVGLPWSAVLDDADAILKALEPRISSKGSPTNEGVGLTLTSELARLTGAWLLIVSGNGYVRISPSSPISHGLMPDGARYPGTLVALTFRQERVQDFAQLMHSAKLHSGLLRTPRASGRFET